MQKLSLGLKMFALVAVSLLFSASGLAYERVDDAGSPRSVVSSMVVLSDDGQPIEDSQNATKAIVRYGQVDYRLAMARYLGREIRLYYFVPGYVPGMRSPSALRVQWRGLGVADGVARPGEHVLVWSGVVREPWMSLALDLTYEIDLRDFELPSRAGVGFEPYFEVEVVK